MPTQTVPPELIVKLQDTRDPATGEFPSLAMVANTLRIEYGYDVGRHAVLASAKRYRTAHGLPPAPNSRRHGHFPWKIPDEAHNDPNGYALHRVARLSLAKQNGGECQLHEVEQRAVDAFWRYLKRTGEDTVIAWDQAACRGTGGWLVRQREAGEEVWHGCMAVNPRPS
jgi:hypothetical protein